MIQSVELGFNFSVILDKVLIKFLWQFYDHSYSKKRFVLSLLCRSSVMFWRCHFVPRHWSMFYWHINVVKSFVQPNPGIYQSYTWIEFWSTEKAVIKPSVVRRHTVKDFIRSSKFPVGKKGTPIWSSTRRSFLELCACDMFLERVVRVCAL